MDRRRWSSSMPYTNKDPEVQCPRRKERNGPMAKTLPQTGRAALMHKLQHALLPVMLRQDRLSESHVKQIPLQLRVTLRGPASPPAPRPRLCSSWK